MEDENLQTKENYEIKSLKLEKNSIIVVSYKRFLNNQEFERAKRIWKGKFPNNLVVIKDSGSEITIKKENKGGE